MVLTFRRAQATDTAVAQQAYRLIIDHLAETVDFPHWHTENHPTPEEVASWVEAGELDLALDEDGETAGVTVLNHHAVDAYHAAAWTVEAEPHEVLVVHALGVVPERPGTARPGSTPPDPALSDSLMTGSSRRSCRRPCRERGCP